MARSSALIVRSQAAETIAGDSPRLWLLADASDCCGALGANRLRLDAGAAGAKTHYHRKSSEAFYVLEGVLEMVIDGETVVLRENDYAVIPPEVPHSFRATAQTGADVFITLVPGIDRFEYFRLLPSIMRGDLDEQALRAIHDRFDVHFVGA